MKSPLLSLKNNEPLLFITGTDTGIGKTYVSRLILQDWQQQGLKTLALKPLASGCEMKNGLWQNSDVLILQAAATFKQPYHVINPIALPEPIAPHLAARKVGLSLTKDWVVNSIRNSLNREADRILIEGVGGWAVPLNEQESMADVVCALNLPVILVVGIKLGCLNHAILTMAAIKQMQINCLGWIANCLAPLDDVIMGNIKMLKARLPYPCLSIVPFDFDNVV